MTGIEWNGRNDSPIPAESSTGGKTLRTVKYGFNGYPIREVDAEWIASNCVGPGWFNIINDLIIDLYKLGWDGRVVQIKEKFGGLRFYLDKSTRELAARINEAEKLSMHTCEETGEAGSLRGDIGWVRTLSEPAYAEAKARYEERF